MAEKIYKGRKVRISVNNKVIYHATECSVNVSTDVEELATKDTTGKVVVPDGHSWTASCNALVAEPDSGDASAKSKFMDILTLQLANTEVTFEFTTGEVGDFVMSGKAFVTSADVTSAVGAAVSGSFSFTGNGSLTLSVVSSGT